MMIVKDETHTLRRCLESVRECIDWWVVCDTGSTDGTQDLVREVLSDVPGELLERPWVDFGHNRQQALDAARRSPHRSPGDYACWIDADQELLGTEGLRSRLCADGHTLTVTGAGATYHRLAIVRLDRPWRWTGVVHEHLELPGARTTHLDAPRVHDRHDGARSRDPLTYHRDAALLEAALAEEPTDPRLQFYLAQSWRDAGEHERALAAYRARAANTRGWDQERWYAGFQVGVLLERVGAPTSEVVEAYLTAYQQDPSRAEPLVELARVERSCDRFESALLFARPATTTSHPAVDALFVDDSCYTWRAWDEVAISSYWTGRYAEAVDAATRALAVRPDDDRLRANLAWCRDRLAAG